MQSLPLWSSRPIGQTYDFWCQSQFLWGGDPEGLPKAALFHLLLHQHPLGSNPHSSGLLWHLVQLVFPASVGLSSLQALVPKAFSPGSPPLFSEEHQSTHNF